jgi:hypothetical protein
MKIGPYKIYKKIDTCINTNRSKNEACILIWSCVILTTQNGQPIDNPLTMHAAQDVINNLKNK